MPKEWSSFRITLVLYIIVLLLPISFYFVYNSFKTIKDDTKVVHQTAWIGGALESIGLATDKKDRKQKISQIDTVLADISQWVESNQQSDLYIGFMSLTEDYTQVNKCWTNYKAMISTKHSTLSDNALECWESANYLAIVVEKMVYLKQKKQMNLFYIWLAVAMILILLTIYLVRIYIHQQMKKHAIHDLESTLFNKKYFMSELKTSSSRSNRHNFPLSLLRITIQDFEKENKTFSNSIKRNTLKVFGSLIHSLVRDGDVPCRYDDNHFLILLPFTEEHSALLLQERMAEALEKDKWLNAKQITFDFNATEFDKKESKEALILRALA
jgi:diguanylate cyclase (GGDEF)-like protein